MIPVVFNKPANILTADTRRQSADKSSASVGVCRASKVRGRFIKKSYHSSINQFFKLPIWHMFESCELFDLRISW